MAEIVTILLEVEAFLYDSITAFQIFSPGTEIDDEDYFATLEKKANLMILQDNQKWTSSMIQKSATQLIVVDDITDNACLMHGKENCNIESENIYMNSILFSIQNNPSHVSLLNDTDLEMLSDMDPDSVVDIISDK